MAEVINFMNFKVNNQDLASKPTQPKQMLKHSNHSESTQTLELPSNSPRSINKLLLVLLIVIITILLTATIGVYWFISSFSQAANISPQELYTTARAGLNSKPLETENFTNILILGLDEIVGQKDDSLLTDTIIVALINNQTNSISLLPIPRDLWIDAYKTKVNAIYYYGEIAETTTGQEFASTIISQVIGVPIHYTSIINLQTLESLINTLDGISINVPNSFTDEKFPRTDVDVSVVTDPNLLYETISFSKGDQIMDGTKALKYIRSRASENLTEGTDLARSRRQAQLLNSIIDKIKTRETLKNPHVLGNLYNLYQQQIHTNLTTEELIGLLLSFSKQPPSLNYISLPIKTSSQDGLLINPATNVHNQWVYEPLDPTWQELHEFLQDSL